MKSNLIFDTIPTPKPQPSFTRRRCPIHSRLPILALLTAATLLALAPTLRAADTPRPHLSFDANWLFQKSDTPNAQSPDLDDKSWRTLNLPHDWSIEGPLAQNNPSGGNGGFAPTGIAWYRKHFATPANFTGKKITIQFDGVYMNSTVYLNGHQIAHQPYGYTTFSADLTPFLAAQSKDNLLAVRVDNSVEPNSRWYTGSGIYRHVWLDITDPVHIQPMGIYAAATHAAADSADLQIQTRVINQTSAEANITLAQDLLDSAGKSVASTTLTQPLSTSTTDAPDRQFIQTLTLANPQLWSPDKPNLYTLRTRLTDLSGHTDIIDTPIGIRDIQFDINKGLLINGQHIKMLGMCLHQDGGAFGVAVPEDIWERRLKLLKAMGCNSVRCSHNPPAPEFLDLCDRLGILVMDEAFDEWTVPKGGLKGSYSTLFNDNSTNDLTTMLLRDRNHPSIALWSIGNEIPQQSTDLGISLAKSLTSICHSIDPTRPVTSACDNVHAPTPTKPEFLAALDIAGYNYVDRWGTYRETYFADDRAKFPDRKFIGTEDVCLGGIRNAYFTPAANGNATISNYPSSMIRAEQLWKFNAVHDYVIGYFMWTGIDYLGEAGAWPRKGSSSGVLDTCGFPKDGYYFYQSQWTTAPMVHALPNWNYPGKPGTIIPVIVYSNCQQVELQLNGKSFGTKSLVFPRRGSTRSWNDITPVGTTADLHLSWDVPFEPGTLKVIGSINNKVLATEEIKTAGPAATISLTRGTGVPPVIAPATTATMNAASAPTAATAPILPTNHLAQIEIRILDSAGTLVPTANIPLTFTIDGPAKLLATDNGDQSSHDPYQANTRPTFNGMALAILQPTAPGHATLTVKSKNLPDATIDFDITP